VAAVLLMAMQELIQIELIGICLFPLQVVLERKRKEMAYGEHVLPGSPAIFLGNHICNWTDGYGRFWFR
jgi:hypothetical protein